MKGITLAVLLLVTMALLLSMGARADELYSYDVYGQNKRTGLMVAGRLWETDKEGNVRGKIYDELTIQTQCNGAWIGYGIAQVGCENGQQYVVRVIEK